MPSPSSIEDFFKFYFLFSTTLWAFELVGRFLCFPTVEVGLSLFNWEDDFHFFRRTVLYPRLSRGYQGSSFFILPVFVSAIKILSG